jgi:hypothetical protein
VQLNLIPSQGSLPLARALLADSGAGSDRVVFDLLLLERDCLLCGANLLGGVRLGRAYTGVFSSYAITVEIPALGFAQNLRVVAVPSAPLGFDGIACFRFLNRFTYGNFGNPREFGLEC